MGNTIGSVTTDMTLAGIVTIDDPNATADDEITTYKPIDAHFISNQLIWPQDQKPEYLPFLQTDATNVFTFWGRSVLRFYFFLETDEIDPTPGSNNKYDKFFIKNAGYVAELDLLHGDNVIKWRGPWVFESSIITNQKGNISRVDCTVSRKIAETKIVDWNSDIK